MILRLHDMIFLNIDRYLKRLYFVDQYIILSFCNSEIKLNYFICLFRKYVLHDQSC